MIPDWMPKESWDAYILMRKEMGKKYIATEHAKTLLIKKLDTMRLAGMDIQAVIDESIMNSWVGLFPVKQIKQPLWNASKPYENAKDKSRREASEQLTGRQYERPNGLFDIN